MEAFFETHGWWQTPLANDYYDTLNTTPIDPGVLKISNKKAKPKKKVKKKPMMMTKKVQI